jgi:hypothetical protein
VHGETGMGGVEGLNHVEVPQHSFNIMQGESAVCGAVWDPG